MLETQIGTHKVTVVKMVRVELEIVTEKTRWDQTDLVCLNQQLDEIPF